MLVKQSFEVPYNWEIMAKVLCNPEFNIEREKIRDSVIECEFKMIDENERDIEFELRTKEYQRKKTGGLNKNGTVQTVTKCLYDIRAKRLRWDYSGEAGKMIRLDGVYFLTPIGDEKTRFVHEITIEVKIPILGKQIAKIIAKDFQKSDPRYESLMRRYLDKMSKE